MSKRKSESLDDDLARLFRKVKKLEKKIRARKDENATETVPLPGVSQELSPMAIEDQEVEIPFNDHPPIPVDFLFNEDCTQLPIQEPNDAAPGDQSSEQIIETLDQGTSTKKDDDTVMAPNAVELIELDDDILEILGDDPTATAKRGPETRKEIASRFQHLAAEGLSKDCRKELMNKYPLPSNCLYVGAPSINPEIKAALTENILKRDKGIESKQKEMASAISCLTEIISLHLSAKEKNNVVLQKLMDVGRILCDIQHGDSVTRRNFILFAVKNDMQEHLKNTKIDTTLFGEQLSETIKSARAVNKSGADLKADTSKTVPLKKTTKPPVAPTLNRKAAPQRRPRGVAQHAQRTREYAAPRAPLPPPPAPAYRTSSTQRQPPLPPQDRRRY